jgi:hypothetical protein
MTETASDADGSGEEAERPKRRKLSLGGSNSPPERQANSEVDGAGDFGGVSTDPAPTVLPANQTGIAFALALAIGAACSMVGLLNGFEFRVVGVLGPVISVVGFGAYGTIQGWAKWPDTRQRFADACYFLGFILTMWALIIGFLPAGMIDSQAIDSRSVLRHFGMALGATAAGLIARILVLQTRNVNRASIEADLDRAGRRIVAEAQALSELLAQARQQIAEDQRQSLVIQQNQASAILAAVREELRATLAPLSEELPQIADKGRRELNLVIDKLATRMETQGQSVDKAGAAMTGAFAAATDGAERIALLTSTGGEGLAALLTRLAQAAAGARDEVAKTGAVAAQMTASGEAAAATAEALKDRVGALKAELDRQIAAISAAPGQVTQVSNATSDAIATFEKRVADALAKSGAQVDGDLTSAANAMTTTIDRFIAELNQIAANEAAKR